MNSPNPRDPRDLLPILAHLLESLGENDVSAIDMVVAGQAAEELLDESLGEFLGVAFSQANMHVVAARDHSRALCDLLNEPVETIAPWTVLRGVLESSALACWLMSKDIGARERSARSLSFRFEGMEQQRKYIRLAGSPDNLQEVSSRINEIVANAKVLGFDERIDRRGRVSSVGMAFPGTTAIVRDCLDEEVPYRLASAMAHAHIWAHQQLGYQAVHVDEDGVHHMQKNIDSRVFVYICQTAINSLAKCHWAKWRINGWKMPSLEDFLIQVFEDSLIPRRKWPLFLSEKE